MQHVKKRAIALTMALILAFSVSAAAADIQPRYNSTIRCVPTLSFNRTTATCNADISAVSGAKIEGTMPLKWGSNSQSWPISGTTTVNATQTHSAVKGQSYTLVLDVTVTGSGGSDHIVKEASGTCS